MAACFPAFVLVLIGGWAHAQPSVSDQQNDQLRDIAARAQALKSRCAAEPKEKKVIHLSSHKESSEEVLGEHWKDLMSAQIQSTERGRELLQRIPGGMPRNRIAITGLGVLAVDGPEPILSSWLIGDLIPIGPSRSARASAAIENDPKQLVRLLENDPELEAQMVAFLSPTIVHELVHRTQRFGNSIYVAEYEQEAFIVSIRYTLEMLRRDIHSFGPTGESNPYIFRAMKHYYTDFDAYLDEVSKDYATPEVGLDHLPTIAERINDPQYECVDFSAQKDYFDGFFHSARRAWAEESPVALGLLAQLRGERGTPAGKP